MWISRATLDHLQKRNAELEAANDWLRVRLNQCERERAMLLQRALSIPIEAPELLREEPRPLAPREVLNANGLPNLAGIDFEDVGDDLAASLGIAHDQEGRIRYRS